MTARLLFKVGECRSQSIEYFVRAGRCHVGKSNGPADCLVVEMLSRLPTEVIYEVTH